MLIQGSCVVLGVRPADLRLTVLCRFLSAACPGAQGPGVLRLPGRSLEVPVSFVITCARGMGLEFDPVTGRLWVCLTKVQVHGIYI